VAGVSPLFVFSPTNQRFSPIEKNDFLGGRRLHLTLKDTVFWMSRTPLRSIDVDIKYNGIPWFITPLIFNYHQISPE